MSPTMARWPLIEAIQCTVCRGDQRYGQCHSDWDSARSILTAANTYTGGTTISAGTPASRHHGGTTGSITVRNVTDNGVLTFDRSDLPTFAGVISGIGGVTQIGTGKTILTGNNTYNGGTTIGSGTFPTSVERLEASPEMSPTMAF